MTPLAHRFAAVCLPARRLQVRFLNLIYLTTHWRHANVANHLIKVDSRCVCLGLFAPSCGKVDLGVLVKQKGWAQALWNPRGSVIESRWLNVCQKSYTSRQVGGELSAVPVTQSDKKKRKKQDLMFIFLPLGPDGDRLSSQV